MQVPRFSPRILYIASKSNGWVSVLAVLPYPYPTLPCPAPALLCPALFVTTDR